MATFIGDYSCKVDAKGRIILPMAFKKQMPVITSYSIHYTKLYDELYVTVASIVSVLSHSAAFVST